MAIRGGKVLRTATAAARKFSAAQSVPAAVSSLVPGTPQVTPSSAVGEFLGIPNVPRSNTDILISKYIRLAQNRLTKKGDFTEQKLSTMLSGDVGIGETVKLLDGRKTGGDFSSPKSTNIRSIVKSKKKK